MALRLADIYLPLEYEEGLKDILGGLDFHWERIEYPSEKTLLLKILLESDEVENLVTPLKKRFSSIPEFRINIFPLEASLPALKEKEKVEKEEDEPEEKKEKSIGRLSNVELYSDISDSVKLTRITFILVMLSSIVAAIGIVNDNVAVIIGAMVIAPLLGPNVALSLATTLGDTDLGVRAVKSIFSEVGLALVVSILIGMAIEFDPTLKEVATRTEVGFGHIVLALASGTAGAFSFTTGMSTALIGVMVAVALLPPLVTSGMLLGAAHFELAAKAFTLFLVNTICINLSGVLTFLYLGIRPATWWKAEKTRKFTRKAIAIWSILLLLLVFLVLFISRK